MSLDGLLNATTVEVDSTLFPTLRLNVGEETNAPQGFLVKLLRPRVTVRVAGGQALVVSPAGPPEDGWPLQALVLAAAAAGGLLLLSRWLK